MNILGCAKYTMVDNEYCRPYAHDIVYFQYVVVVCACSECTKCMHARGRYSQCIIYTMECVKTLQSKELILVHKSTVNGLQHS